MPFFPERSKNYVNKIKTTTLQVRISIQSRGKRVWLFIFGQRAEASLTIEAALSFSLMIFAMVVLIVPLKIMDTQRQIQAALESVGEELSEYAYVKYKLEQGDDQALSGGKEVIKEAVGFFLTGVSTSYAQAKVLEKIKTDRLEHVEMGRSSILEDGVTIDLVMDYEIRLPFPVLGLKSISATARCCRRAWIGKEGKDRGDLGSGEIENEVVYVGKGSTRYHRSRDCHYLSNDLSGVSFESLEGLRNKGGARYQPCQSCKAKPGSGATVYVTPYGNHYHTSSTCKSIVAYVRAVHLSEVEQLGGCSYCTKD